MKRTGLFLAAILLTALPLHAQHTELSVSYAYSPSGSGAVENEVAQGWAVNLSNNFIRYFGLTTDITGERGTGSTELICIAIVPTPPGCIQDINFSTYHLMSGPRVIIRARQASVFVHWMLGVALTKFDDFTVGSITIENNVRAHFATNIGGGLDVNLIGPLALRAVQYDHVRVKVGDTWVGNNRLRFGLVLKF